MAESFSIIRPLAKKNWLKNPSFESWSSTAAASNWTNKNSPVVSQAATVRYGHSSAQIVAGSCEGLFQAITGLTASGNYRHSVYVKNSTASAGTIKLLASDGASTSGAATAQTTSSNWTRLAVTKAATTGGATRMTVQTIGGSTATFFVDGAQVESGTAATTFIDGDQPGCYWDGAKYTSTSQRDSQAREGGTVVDLTDLVDGIQVLTGMGHEPVEITETPYGDADGAVFHALRGLPRDVTIAVNLNATASLSDLQTLRQALIDDLKIDRVHPQQPLILRYDSGVTGEDPRDLAVYYAGGLEGEWAAPSRLETIGLRLHAPDPMWYSPYTEASDLNANQTITANGVVSRINGQWGNLSGGTDSGEVYALVIGKDNTLYAAGTFLTMDGVANTARIAKWDGTSWTALGTGANNPVLCLAIDAQDRLYAGGSFTQMGGVASTDGFAMWNGSAWSAVGGGPPVGTNVSALAFDSAGNLYIGGNFTNWGDANGDRIVKWNGTAYSSLGTGISTNSVLALLCDRKDRVLAGGTFTGAGGVANTSGLARWSGTAWTSIATLAATGIVNAIARRGNGIIYIGGNGMATGEHLWRYTGTAMSLVGDTGPNDEVQSLHWSTLGDRTLYLGGIFTNLDGVTLDDRVGRWTQGAYRGLDINLPGAARVYAFATRRQQHQKTLYVGFDTRGSATAAGTTTTVTNSGTAKAYPVIYIKGPGTLLYLRNNTTDQELAFNYAPVAGETAVLDLSKATKTFTSDVNGNVLDKIRTGSDLSSFCLLPGTNSIAIYMKSTTSASDLRMMWRPRDHSADAASG